jgi:hypothetical protein
MPELLRLRLATRVGCFPSNHKFVYGSPKGSFWKAILPVWFSMDPTKASVFVLGQRRHVN